MAVSMERLIEAIRSLDLAGESDIAAARQSLPPPKDQIPEALAEELVRRKKLTRFQALNLCQDRAKYLLLGNYVVQDQIGAGGMGQVYLGRHRRLDRPVALKVLPKKALGTSTAVDRFLREGRAAARLSHPNIVAVFDADEAGGVHFLAMEYVEGESLSQLVKRVGPIDVERAIGYVIQAARGLGHAHAAGVVHRDVKPSNLLVDKSGTVKVLDLGLARLQDPLAEGAAAEAQEELTQAGQIMGTIDYMAPEQAFDTRQSDARADVYSLGCTLHFLLTGKSPYSGSSVMERLLKHRESPIPDLPAHAAEINGVFLKMLAKDPAQRPQTMDETAAALEHALRMRSATSVLPPTVPAKGPGGSSVDMPKASIFPQASPFPAAATPTTVASLPTAAAFPSAASFPGSTTITSTSGFPTIHSLPKGKPLAQAASKSKPKAEDEPETGGMRRHAPVAIVGVAAVIGIVAIVLWLKQSRDRPQSQNAAPGATAATSQGQPAATANASDSGPAESVAPFASASTPQTPAISGAPIAGTGSFFTPPTPIPLRTAAEILGPPKGLDLLQLIDIDETVFKGQDWTRDAAGAVTMGLPPPDEKDGIIHYAAVEFAPPDEYVVRAIAERIEGRGALALGFVAYGQQAFVRAFDPIGVQIGPLDGEGWVDDENKTRRPFSAVPPNGPWAIECRVAKSGITVAISGEKLIEWQGNAQRLEGGRGRWLPSQPVLFIGAHKTSRFRVTRWEIATLDGGVPTAGTIAVTPVVVPPPVTPTTTTPPVASRGKPPIPSTADQAAALAQLKQTFRKEYAAAAKPDGKLPLAGSLLRTADVTESDPVSRYVMLAEARDAASQAGDLNYVDWSLDEISWNYDVELPELYEAAYAELAQLKLTPAQHRRIADTAFEQIDATHDYAVGLSLAKSAVVSARKTLDANFIRHAVDVEKTATENLEAYEAAEQARAKLASAADDAAAHLALGKFLCFIDDRAEEGFPHLAAGGDALLSDLAQAELDAGNDPGKRVAALRGWRLAAEQLKAKDQEQLKHVLEEFAKRRCRELLPTLQANSVEQRNAQLEWEALEAVGTPRTARPPTPGEPDRSFAVGLFGLNVPNKTAHSITVEADGAAPKIGIRDAAGLPSGPFTVTEVVINELGQQPLGPVLAQLAGLRSLRKLTLNTPQMTDADAQPLSQLTHLVELHLTNTPNVANATTEFLRPLRALEVLEITSPKIDDHGLIALRRLTTLKRLDLRGTSIDDDGLIHLKGLVHLTSLNLQGTRVLPDGVARIAKRLPNCRVAANK